jgi:hypothetical protein
MTPVEVVWGISEEGEQFWWDLDRERVVILRAPGIYELWEGSLCEEHGLDGKSAGWAFAPGIAFEWVAGGDAPALEVH